MPVFQYTGLRGDGKTAAGIIDAENPKGARLKLRREGVYPTSLVEQMRAEIEKGSARPSSLRTRHLSQQELAVLTRQLGTLLVAGLPLVEALGILIEQVDRPQTKSLLAGLREEIREGKALSEALKGYSRDFHPVYLHMVRAGEASGALDRILFRLADFLDQHLSMKQKITNATLYPALMIVVGVAVLVVLLAFVVPKITAVFNDLQQTLPWPTLLLIYISEIFRNYGLVFLAGAMVLGLVLRHTLRTDRGRLRADRFLLRVPVIGLVLSKAAIARFSKTLETLLASGVPVLEALEVSKQVMSNRVLEEAVEMTRKEIREGGTIAGPLRQSGVFPALVTHLIGVGEKSGNLEEMLGRIGHMYEGDVERVITRLTALLEPGMILVMGAIVFFIVVAILLPIFEMSQMVG